MSHLAFAEQPVELEVDAVVVGSGAGGSMAAITLARAGLSVAMVEAGAWRDPDDYPHSTYGAMRDLFDDWGTTLVRGRAMWPVVQARTVGGTPVINSAICVRTPGDIFALWREDHGVDDLEEAVGLAQDAIEAELQVEVPPEAALGRNNALPQVGAQALGYRNHLMRRFATGCEGSGRCMSGCRGHRKRTGNLVYAPELLQRGGTVLSNAPVDRVIFEGRRAVGVSGRFRDPRGRRGAAFTVRARQAVVLAASATRSPCLLQASGYRSPALGQGFRAHPGTAVLGVYDEPVDMHRGATQAWASLAFREDPGLKLESLSIPADMLVSRLYGGGAALTRRMAGYRHLAMWVHAIRAETVGTVRRDWFGKPLVRYSLVERDMHRFRKGMAILARTHFAAGARQVLPGVFGLPPAIGPDEVGLIDEGPLDPRRYFAVLSHLFGGCTMGADPARSVVDGHGRVHEADGLYVMDASAIPTTLGVNPQHTIMALARVWAERLAEGG